MTGDVTTLRVFISHSGTDGRVGRLLTKLVDTLTNDGFVPLIDMTRIRTGTEFAPEVDDMVSSCDAAVVVVGTRALMSPWVRYEAGVLASRARTARARGDHLALVPVFIEGLEPSALSAEPDWAPVRLSDYAGVVGDDDDRIVAGVLEALAEVREYGRAMGMAWNLAQKLRKLGDPDLTRLAAPLFPQGRAPAYGDIAVWVARRLLGHDATPNDGAVDDLLEKLAAQDRGVAAEVFEFVLPFLWVDRRAAAIVANAARSGKAVWLNTSRTETAVAYARCASSELPWWEVVPAPEAHDPENVDALVEEFIALLDRRDGELPARVRRRRAAASDRPRLLAVPSAGCFDTAIIDAFAASRLASCAKLMMAGPVSWSEVPPEVRSELELVEPELSPSQEEEGDELARWLSDMLSPASPR